MAAALGRRSDLFMGAYEWFTKRAAITSGTRRAGRFGTFGDNTVICFPPEAVFGEHAIHIGKRTLIGPRVSLSAGMGPGQDLIGARIVTIGNDVLIGRGSSVAGHLEIVIEDEVFFGPNVYVTDQNHGVEQIDVAIGRQTMSEAPVRIGWGSWLGTNSVVLPGVTIGRHVAVGAGSVVTSDLPDNCVAVGSPARVVGQH